MLHHIIFISVCAQNARIEHKRKWATLMQLTNSMFNNAQPRVVHSLLMHHFSSSTYNIKTHMISVRHVTDFQRLCNLQ